MQESTSREKVLKKIRKALIHKTRNPYPTIDFESPVYTDSGEPPDITFAREFTRVGGQFVFCEDELSFVESILLLAEQRKWQRFMCFERKIAGYLDKCSFPYTSDRSGFNDVAAGITLCESLVARTGSIFVSSRQMAGRQLGVFSPAHIILAYTSQLVKDVKDALQLIRKKYGDQVPSAMTLITGPSRTADIEKTLVTGAHGPKEIFVFLIDDSSSAGQ